MDVLTNAQKALTDSSKRAALAGEIGKLAEGQENAHKAIEQYKSVLRQNPDDSSARDALKRRLPTADAAKKDLLAAQEDLLASRDEVLAARARIEELESSTMWRATAPLRHSGTAAKIIAARMHARWSAVRGSARYVRLAMTVLRNEGPRALTRRVWRRLNRGRRFVPSSRTGFALETEILPLAFPVSPAPRATIIAPALPTQRVATDRLPRSS